MTGFDPTTLNSAGGDNTTWQQGEFLNGVSRLREKFVPTEKIGALFVFAHYYSWRKVGALPSFKNSPQGFIELIIS
jgi:hypothetical protein